MAGPPIPTGIICFLPHMPAEDQDISEEIISIVFNTSNATPEIVVSFIALPNFPFLISYPIVIANMNSLVESACPFPVLTK